MPKFKIYWQEEVIQYWSNEVEAENEEEAKEIFYNGDHITGDEVLEDTQFIESEFNDVEEVTEEKTAEDVYLCDDCQNTITKAMWQRNQGLCDACVDKIN